MVSQVILSKVTTKINRPIVKALKLTYRLQYMEIDTPLENYLLNNITSEGVTIEYPATVEKHLVEN